MFFAVLWLTRPQVAAGRHCCNLHIQCIVLLQLYGKIKYKQISKQKKQKKIYGCSADLGLLKGFKGPSLNSMKSSVGVLILEAVWKHSNQTVKGGPY